MARILKRSTLIVLSLVLVAGVVAGGCSEEEEEVQLAEMVAPTVELINVFRGNTTDLDNPAYYPVGSTVDSISKGGGEEGWKTGTAAQMYAATFDAARDATAAALMGYGMIGHDVYAECTSGEQSTVNSTIFATVLTAEQQNAVMLAVAAFFDGYAAEIAAGTAVADTTAYGILAGLDAVNYTKSAEGFASYVNMGIDASTAFYIWLAKPGSARR